MRTRVLLATLLLSVALPFAPLRAQEPDPVGTWQALVNQARLAEGLPPYEFSQPLAAAAQRHAQDLADHQTWSHTGTDGSTSGQRIAEAGYAAWTWNSGEPITGENYWTGHGTIQDAMAFFMEDPPHRKNILNPVYREIGIAVAVDVADRNYYVLDFGARPNVLPVFLNDGAISTDSPQLAIRLTNEEAHPGGEGTSLMGRAIEVRISNEPAFDDLPWSPWDPLLAWAIPNTLGEHTVYVQFRDSAGRTAGSADTIVLGEGMLISPTPVPSPPTLEPTATPVPSTSTPEPTASPVPTKTSVPTDTPTPEPAATAKPTSVPSPSFTVSPSPSPTNVWASSGTPFPTWTPLASPPPTTENNPRDPAPPFAVLAILQVLAIILGIPLALRRRGPRRASVD